MQLRINEYYRLAEFATVFNQNKLDLLIVEGSAGAGKSSIIKHIVTAGGSRPTGEYLWLEGRITASAFYEKLYANRDLPIILDDVDGFYRDKESINLLKCVCQTDPVKTVMMNTMNRMRPYAGAVNQSPPSFQTTSKVLIITNSWRTLNKHVTAVTDRGLLLMFHPSAMDIHQYVFEKLSGLSTVFDEEIYNFIGTYVPIIKEPSIRHYRNSIQLKESGLNWQEVLIESFGLDDETVTVLKLFHSNDSEIINMSNNQRSVHFARITDTSTRTFYRIYAELRDKGIKFDND